MSDDHILNESANGDVVKFPVPDDSHFLTFDLERANLRGRILRLGKVLDTILSPHHFPEAIEKLLVETMTLSVLLSSMLKYEGIFILQTQSNGMITRLVSDVTSSGEVRATAGFDKEKMAEFLEEKPDATATDLLGTGYLAFTVDQGEFTERYQGIVELKGTLLESIDHYFSQSEQIGTAIKMAVGKGDDGKWRAGAIMLQHTPDHSKIPQDSKPIAENWNRAQILLETCRDDELLDPKLHDETLLYRLFHEEGVIIYKPQRITKGCRCTPEKLKGVLATLTAEDLDHVAIDGKVTMTCEFCNQDFNFLKEEL
jgi:molecular chaperone Hsp33